MSHPWPGSPLHHRVDTQVPGSGPPRTARQPPRTAVIWPLGCTFHRWLFQQATRCAAPVPSEFRHCPGKAALSSRPIPLRVQRCEFASLHGLTTTGASHPDPGPSTQASPNRLLNWTGPSALAPPAPSTARPNTVPNSTRARRASPTNRGFCISVPFFRSRRRHAGSGWHTFRGPAPGFSRSRAACPRRCADCPGSTAPPAAGRCHRRRRRRRRAPAD